MPRWILIGALAAGGCSSSTSDDCNEDCPSGTLCFDGECREICVDDRDCSLSTHACSSGVCLPGGPGGGDTPTGDANAGDTSRGDTAMGDTKNGDVFRGDTNRGDTSVGDTSMGDTSGPPGCNVLPPSALLLQETTAATPPGWTCVSCGALDPFYQQFVVGAGSFGGTGGSTTHSHPASFTSLSTGAIVKTRSSGTNNDSVSTIGHTHSIAAASTPAVDHTPPYMNVKVVRPISSTELVLAQALVDVPVPQGMLIFFEADPGSGDWTIRSGSGGPLEGMFIKGAAMPALGLGGDVHATSGTVNTGSSDLNAQFYQPPAGCGAAGGQTRPHANHTHSVTMSVDAQDHRPPFVEAIIAQLTT